jgi:hypothetical protein
MHSDIRSFQFLLYIINCVIWHFHIRYSHNLYIGGRIVFFFSGLGSHIAICSARRYILCPNCFYSFQLESTVT